MARVCPGGKKPFDYGSKYYSERRSCKARQRPYQFIPALLIGVLVFLFASCTAPGEDLRPEPSRKLSIAELNKLAKNEFCPVCDGKGKVDCKVCIDGKIFYMGTNNACYRCDGKGWIICPACKGTGKLKDALAAAVP